MISTAAPVRRPARRSTLGDAARAELIKLFSLRSLWLAMVTAVVLGTGVSAIRAFAAGRGYATLSASDKATFDPTSTGMVGYLVAQLIIGVLGVLMITSEHATGLIIATLTTIPRRRRVLGSKLIVLTVVALIISELQSFAAFAISQTILQANGAPTASLADADVLRAVIGCGLYLTTVALLGLGLGTLIRATAGALAVIVAVTFMIPALIPVFPDDWARALGTYWPTMAARSLMSVHPDPNVLGPWAGFGVMCGFVMITLIAAFSVFDHRDV